MITVTEAAKLLRVSPRYVRMMIADEKIKAKKVGWGWMIDEKSVKRWIQDKKRHKDRAKFQETCSAKELFRILGME